jgi:hypothetical protein
MNPTDPNTRPVDVEPLTGQNKLLAERLSNGDKITPREAYALGITRLAARVYDLKRHGINVRSDYCARRRCAVYWLPLDPNEQKSKIHPTEGASK